MPADTPQPRVAIHGFGNALLVPLSPLRDAHTAVVAYDALLDRYRGEVHRRQFATVGRRLVQAEGRCTSDSSDLEDRYARVRAEMEATRHRIDDWSITDVGVETWRDGFMQTYRRASRAVLERVERGAALPPGDGRRAGDRVGVRSSGSWRPDDS